MKDRRVSEIVAVPESLTAYGDGRVDGVGVLSLFLPLVQALGVAVDDTAFLRRLREVEFLAPVYVGESLNLSAAVVEEEELGLQIAFSAAKSAPSADSDEATSLMIPVLEAVALYITPRPL